MDQESVVVKIEGFSLTLSDRGNVQNSILNQVTIKKEPGIDIDNQDMLMKINWLETQIQPILHIKRLPKSKIFKSKMEIKNLQNFSKENCRLRQPAKDISINQYEKIVVNYERAFIKQEMIFEDNNDQVENIFEFEAFNVKLEPELEPISEINLHHMVYNEQEIGSQNQVDNFQNKIYEKRLLIETTKKEIKRPHKCLLCSKCFPHFGNLDIHMRTHTREKPFFCKKCPKIFAENSKLKSHKYLHKHKGKKPFPCTETECTKRYMQKSDLNRHILAEHSDNFIPYSCSRCQKTFKCKSNLTRHEESRNSLGQCPTKSLKKPEKCSICSVMFKTTYSLSLHMRKHTEILNLPHKCTFCTNSFTSKEYLKIHLQLHTDKESYTCKVCSKKLSNKRSLTRHCATFHNRDKSSRGQFNCPDCPKTFFLNDHLKSHSLFHSRKKELLCPFCNVKYRYRQNLNSHLRSKH